MEERRLNFNQPLLSVRRGSSVTAQPEVNHRKTHHSKSNLPPLPYYKSDLKSGPIRNPGVVPFQWEQMPGRPKHENIVPLDKNSWQLAIAPKLPPGKLAIAPKLPPGRIANHKRTPIDKTLESLPVLDMSSMDEKESKDRDSSSSEDENLIYADAHDSLSRSESFFNCSVSGVTGLDNPSLAGSGIFANSQTQDFMMDRFLPAAKAMTSETPHFVSKKDSSTKEQLKPVKRVIKWKQKTPQYTLPHYVHGKVEDDEEDEDEFNGMDDMPVKLCGLLPKFCVLNPIPGMKNHAQTISSVKSVRTRPAYAESCRKNEKKDRRNGHKGDLMRMPHKSASTKESFINQKFSIQGIVPLKDGSPELLIGKEKQILALPWDFTDLKANEHDLQNYGGAKFQEVSGLQGSQLPTSPANPSVEKTLYVDYEQTEQSRNSISSSSESRGRNPSVDSLQDIKSITTADEKQIYNPKTSDTSEKSFQGVREDLQRDQDFNLGVVLVQRLKPDVNEGIEGNSLPAFGPILPKSPSESWLSRTLPSMPTKNSTSKSYLGNLTFRSSPVDSMRERMSRNSNLQPHMVYRPARELGPILEN